jgi:carotenoid cleavage dioxygenase
MTAHRWTLDPATGKAAEETTDDLVTEFPTIDDRLVGLPNRHSYALAFPGGGRTDWAVVKYDNRTGGRALFDLGRDRLPGEPCFVPADGSTGDDHGYLMTIVSDLGSDSSELLILDASDLTEIAAVELPRRVPAGIHGSWIPDSDLA